MIYMDAKCKSYSDPHRTTQNLHSCIPADCRCRSQSFLIINKPPSRDGCGGGVVLVGAPRQLLCTASSPSLSTSPTFTSSPACATSRLPLISGRRRRWPWLQRAPAKTPWPRRGRWTGAPPTPPPQPCGPPSCRRRPCSTTPPPLSVRATFLSDPPGCCCSCWSRSVAPSMLLFDLALARVAICTGSASKVFACLSCQN